MQGKEKEKSSLQGRANTVMVSVLLTKCLMCLNTQKAQRDERGQHRREDPSAPLQAPQRNHVIDRMPVSALPLSLSGGSVRQSSHIKMISKETKEKHEKQKQL